MASTTFPSKNNFVTVLAIYDKSQSSNSVSSTLNSNKGIANAPTVISIVPHNNESNSDDQIRTNGLRVNKQSSCHLAHGVKNVSSSSMTSTNSPPALKSAMKKDFSEKIDDSFRDDKRSIRSVSIEPNAERETNRFLRNDARKSRVSEAFIDAKDRLDQEAERYSNKFNKSSYSFHKICIGPETLDSQLGIEVSAVYDPDKPNRLLSMEVIRIEENGRIAQDGRMRVSDQIVEIEGAPCREISFARAKLRLRDLASISEPTIAFQRRIQLSKPPDVSQNEHITSIKPVITALQQGNTSQIYSTRNIVIEKSSSGFGFSFGGRLNAHGEHMYYVKSVKQLSPSNLMIGDRLLKINGVGLESLQQSEVSGLLKSFDVGEKIELLISRAVENDQKVSTALNESGASCSSDYQRGQSPSSLIEDTLRDQLDSNFDLLRFDIPLNDSPSAGIGISLKAQRKFIGGVITDSGLFIKSVLQGSAAYKDGRLKIDDHLLGIEKLNLLNFNLNGEALEAFMRCISALPSTSSFVRLYVARKKSLQVDNATEFRTKKTVFRSDSLGEQSGSLRPYGSDSELSQVSSFDPTAFIRNTVARRSISEKHPFGMHTDPSHLKTYQRILHRRQTSAPSLTVRNAKINNSSLLRRSFGDENDKKTVHPMPIMFNETLLKLSERTKKSKSRPITICEDTLFGNNEQNFNNPKLYDDDDKSFQPSVTVTGFSPKILRKFGPSSFKSTRSKVTEFFTGIITSNRKSYREQFYKQKSPDTEEKHYDVKKTLTDKENYNDENDDLLNSSSNHRSKGVGVSAISKDFPTKKASSVSHSERCLPEFKISNSSSHPELQFQQTSNSMPNEFVKHQQQLFTSDKSTEKRKSFGNGLMKFLKGASNKDTTSKCHRSSTSEFYSGNEFAAVSGHHSRFSPSRWPAGHLQMCYPLYDHQLPPYYYYQQQQQSSNQKAFPPYAYHPQQMYFHQRGYSEYDYFHDQKEKYFTQFDHFNQHNGVDALRKHSTGTTANTFSYYTPHNYFATMSQSAYVPSKRDKVKSQELFHCSQNQDVPIALPFQNFNTAASPPVHYLTGSCHNPFMDHHHQQSRQYYQGSGHRHTEARDVHIIQQQDPGLCQEPLETDFVHPKTRPTIIMTASTSGSVNNPTGMSHPNLLLSETLRARDKAKHLETSHSLKEGSKDVTVNTTKVTRPPFDSSTSDSDDTASYFPPAESTHQAVLPPSLTPANQKQRQKLLRRATPSAIFYDDCEPPVRC